MGEKNKTRKEHLKRLTSQAISGDRSETKRRIEKAFLETPIGDKYFKIKKNLNDEDEVISLIQFADYMAAQANTDSRKLVLKLPDNQDGIRVLKLIAKHMMHQEAAKDEIEYTEKTKEANPAETEEIVKGITGKDEIIKNIEIQAKEGVISATSCGLDQAANEDGYRGKQIPIMEYNIKVENKEIRKVKDTKKAFLKKIKSIIDDKGIEIITKAIDEAIELQWGRTKRGQRKPEQRELIKGLYEILNDGSKTDYALAQKIASILRCIGYNLTPNNIRHFFR